MARLSESGFPPAMTPSPHRHFRFPMICIGTRKN